MVFFFTMDFGNESKFLLMDYVIPIILVTGAMLMITVVMFSLDYDPRANRRNRIRPFFFLFAANFVMAKIVLASIGSIESFELIPARLATSVPSQFEAFPPALIRKFAHIYDRYVSEIQQSRNELLRKLVELRLMKLVRAFSDKSCVQLYNDYELRQYLLYTYLDIHRIVEKAKLTGARSSESVVSVNTTTIDARSIISQISPSVIVPEEIIIER